MNVNFTRTRNVLTGIAKKRGVSFSERENSTRKQFPRRPKRGTKKKPKQVSNYTNQDNEFYQNERTSSRTDLFNRDFCAVDHRLPLTHMDNNNYQSPVRNVHNNLKNALQNSQSGVLHNYTDMADVEVKPPSLSMGRDNFGPYVEIVGSEALAPLTVKTITTTPIANVQPTAPGDIILEQYISPTALSGTSFSYLVANYGRWMPTYFKVAYQPLGSAIQSGGIVAAFPPDPSASFTLHAGDTANIQRAYSMQGAIGANVYNPFAVEAPKLPQMEEPFYTINGQDVRLEVPYKFIVIAETSYEADATGNVNRNLGWLTIHYVVRCYNKRLPDLTNSVIQTTFNMVGLSYLAMFNGDIDSGDIVDLSATSVFGVSQPDRDKVYQIYVPTVPTTSGAPPFAASWRWEFASEGPIDINRGQVFYAKYRPQSHTIRFYYTLEQAYVEAAPAVWRNAHNMVNTMDTGQFYFVSYDLSHIAN
jgi:hypothetical protein